MRIHDIALTLALMLSTTHALAEDTTAHAAMDETPTFRPPDIDEEEVTNRYIIKFKAGSKTFKKRMGRASKRYRTNNLRKRNTPDDMFLTYGSFLPQDNAEVVYLNSEEEIKEWEGKDDVEYVERDTKVYLQEEEITEHTPYGINKVHALDIPDTNISNRKVCIIDSGYDISHPDLPSDSTVVTGYTGPLSAGPWNQDASGHGTHVAGTIAAIGGNGNGVVGISRNGELKLHIVRVFGYDGLWAWGSTVIAAVEECVDNGANVVNMSLGGPYHSQAASDAYDRIFNENVLLVAAAGNGANTDYAYPASYDSVMSVGGTDQNDNLYTLSQRNDQVDIAAPGVGVLSTVPTSVIPSGYAAWSGTSMATPHVSGVAALVWSLDTTKSAAEIREALEATAEDLGPEGRDDAFGHGLVRADKAAEFLGHGNGNDCVDSSESFDWSDMERDCEWLSGQQQWKKEYICTNFPDIADICPKTCDTCHTNKITINFDEVSSQQMILPYYREDIQMENWYYFDASDYYSSTGYNYGTKSDPNVAFNGWGYPMTMRCPGGKFNLSSLWLTPAWSYHLGITLEGYTNGSLTASYTVTIYSPHMPMHLDGRQLAAFRDIDSLTIKTSVPSQVAVDDMKLEITSPCTVQALMLAQSAVSFEAAAAAPPASSTASPP